MSVVKKIFKTKDLVENYLKSKKGYRDDDEILVSRFWYDELRRQGIVAEQITGYELLKLYAKGKLTSADVITRARRKAQEDDPSLKGDKDIIRDVEEKDVRQNINKP